MMKTFLLFLAIACVAAHQISDKENMELQKSCGRKIAYQRKMINGRLANPGDYPWAVTVYIRLLNHSTSTPDDYHIIAGPGTIISPLHIISYNVFRKEDNMLNILNERTGQIGTCHHGNLIIPGSLYHRYDVDFEHFDTLNNTREFKNSIGLITVINGCNNTNPSNLLIIELNEPMVLDNKRIGAACIPNSPKLWAGSQSWVIGMNVDAHLVSAQFVATECEAAWPMACATAVEKNQGLCQGDFGGSAVAKVDDHYTILGVYTSGNTKCRADPKTLPAFRFVNVGYFRQEICEVTGVCVAPPYEEVSHIPPFGSDAYTTAYTADLEETTVASETTTEFLVYTDGLTEGYTQETTTDFDIFAHTASTQAYEETTAAPKIGEDGEVIVAETFQPFYFPDSDEEIKAEHIDPMAIKEVGSQVGSQTQNQSVPIRANRCGGTVNINIYV